MSVTVELSPYLHGHLNMINLATAAQARSSPFLTGATPPLGRRGGSPARFTSACLRDSRSPSPGRALGTLQQQQQQQQGNGLKVFTGALHKQCLQKTVKSSCTSGSSNHQLSTKLSQISISTGTGCRRSVSSCQCPSVSPSELATRLQAPKQQSPDLFLLDCRSFIAFNLGHINGSLNVCCTDRCSKRRLHSGKASISDMVKGTDAEKDAFKDGLKAGATIVLYDDRTTELLDEADPNTPIQLVRWVLQQQGANVSFLQGGLENFQQRFGDLVSQCAKPPPRAPLYSPTTPLIQEPAIDTATASQILPFLYLGNERDAANEERLRELGITHVLNVTAHLPMYFESGPLHLKYKRLQASDSGQQNLKQYFNDACEFIESVRSVGGRVLVHCQAGVSRSATITIAYIMKHSSLAMNDAFRYVKGRRSIVSPNFNFMGQLLSLEQGLAQELETRGPLLQL